MKKAMNIELVNAIIRLSNRWMYALDLTKVAAFRKAVYYVDARGYGLEEEGDEDVTIVPYTGENGVPLGAQVMHITDDSMYSGDILMFPDEVIAVMAIHKEYEERNYTILSCERVMDSLFKVVLTLEDTDGLVIQTVNVFADFYKNPLWLGTKRRGLKVLETVHTPGTVLDTFPTATE